MSFIEKAVPVMISVIAIVIFIIVGSAVYHTADKPWFPPKEVKAVEVEHSPIAVEVPSVDINAFVTITVIVLPTGERILISRSGGHVDTLLLPKLAK